MKNPHAWKLRKGPFKEKLTFTWNVRQSREFTGTKLGTNHISDFSFGVPWGSPKIAQNVQKFEFSFRLKTRINGNAAVRLNVISLCAENPNVRKFAWQHFTVRFVFIREVAPHDEVVQAPALIIRLTSAFILCIKYRMFRNSVADSWGISTYSGHTQPDRTWHRDFL